MLCWSNSDMESASDTTEAANMNKDGFLQPADHIHFTIPSKKLNVDRLDSDESDRKNNSNGGPKNATDAISESESKDNDAKLPADVPYKIPPWSARCAAESDYFLEILKNGCIIDNVDLRVKPFYVFGRLSDCHFQLEHPSISRYHTVLQYRGSGNKENDEIGWYLYDLGSTHGTFVNKQRLPAHMHVRFKVGHVMKLGGSSRLFVLHGPDEDVEAESELTVTEIKQKGEKQRSMMDLAKIMKINIKNRKEAEILAKKEAPEVQQPKDSDGGIDWGMGLESYGDKDDDEGEDEGEKMDFEDIQKREQFYIDDPKKALKNFFDRQGFELNYEYIEKGSSSNRQWHCRVELPVETSTGRIIYAEVTVGAGKKEAAAACALEGCRMLDAYGVLRKSNQDSKKRPAKNLQDQDFYDSDEDNYFDRTGELERKRISRLKRFTDTDPQHFNGSSVKKPKTTSVDNYESLQAKLAAVECEIEKVKNRLADLNSQLHGGNRSQPQTHAGHDPLDDYMMNMSRGDATFEVKVQCSKLRLRLVDLNQSASRYKKLVALAKPSAALPRLSPTSAADHKKPTPVLTGKIKRAAAPKVDTFNVPRESRTEPKTVFVGQEEIEVDDEEAGSSAVLIEKISKDDSPQLTNKIDDANKMETKSNIKKDVAPEVSNHNQEKPKQRAQQPVSQKQSKKKTDAVPFIEYDRLNDPDYAVWMPPEDQRGDGRTLLNDKLGY